MCVCARALMYLCPFSLSLSSVQAIGLDWLVRAHSPARITDQWRETLQLLLILRRYSQSCWWWWWWLLERERAHNFGRVTDVDLYMCVCTRWLVCWPVLCRLLVGLEQEEEEAIRKKRYADYILSFVVAFASVLIKEREFISSSIYFSFHKSRTRWRSLWDISKVILPSFFLLILHDNYPHHFTFTFTYTHTLVVDNIP